MIFYKSYHSYLGVSFDFVKLLGTHFIGTLFTSTLLTLANSIYKVFGKSKGLASFGYRPKKHS